MSVAKTKDSPRALVLKESPSYEANPFMKPDALQAMPKTRRNIHAPKRSAVFEAATGDEIGKADGFYRRNDVDATQHIKLYLEGIGALSKLSKSGLAVFQALYCQMLKQANKARVSMTPHAAKKLRGISQSVYFAGMSQLIEAGFIAKTDEYPFYWINHNYVFNGNRLRFVQDYDLKIEKDEADAEYFLQVTTRATLEANRKAYDAKHIDLKELFPDKTTSDTK